MPGDRLLRDNIPVPLRTLDILDYKSDAVCVFDRDWRFAYASSPAVTLARVPGEKLMGGNLWELFPKVAGSALETSFRATMGDGTHRRVEYFYEPYDLWVEIDTWATPAGLAIIVRDISHRKKADLDGANLSPPCSENRNVFVSAKNVFALR